MALAMAKEITSSLGLLFDKIKNMWHDSGT